MALAFDRSFDPAYGSAVEISPGVRRLTARNPGGYTFHGTNSYLLGTTELTVVDPGPDDPEHRAAILAAAGGVPIREILITHTHRDHSPGAAPLAAVTGAAVIGAGPHNFSRPLHIGETTALDASADLAYRPDRILGDGERVATAAGPVVALATPGHTANHLCFVVEEAGLILSGDHVMAWSTSIVAPPDGSMADYMASLDRLAGRPEVQYLPGHGAPVRNAHRFVEGLKAHRLGREAAVLAALRAGDRSIEGVVRRVYADTDPKLWGAAALSVFAQLEWLVAKGVVATEGEPRLDGAYRPTE